MESLKGASFTFAPSTHTKYTHKDAHRATKTLPIFVAQDVLESFIAVNSCKRSIGSGTAALVLSFLVLSRLHRMKFIQAIFIRGGQYLGYGMCWHIGLIFAQSMLS